MKHWRQALHLEPPDGWLNDPNGLCRFGGLYHVYFQYSPGPPDGSGPRGWGHFESPDLLHWRCTGTALRPDTPADRSGVYSGSAVAEGDTLWLYYTGNVKLPGPYDYTTAGRESNVLRVSTRDGVTFTPKELLLTTADYPANCSLHVRDPKVWRQGDVWYLLLGARTRQPGDDGGKDTARGEALLYRSADGRRWDFWKAVTTPAPFGYMWECPDWFVLGGRGVLSVSPQGLPHGENRFQNVYQSGWFAAGAPGEEALGAFTEWDMGFDFYAPQTFADGDRRLLIGWMGMPEAPYRNATAALGGWQHCLTLPRELHWNEQGKLCQTPARELDALRAAPRDLADGEPAALALPFEVCAQFAPGADWALTLADGLCLSWDESARQITLRFDEKRQDLGAGRTVRRALLPDGCRDLRLIADRASAEFYLNGGETVFSTRLYPPPGPVRCRLCGAAARLTPLNSMEVVYDGR